MPAPRNDLDTDHIVNSYQGGESIHALSKRLTVSGDAIRRVLRIAGVNTRNKSQAGFLRAARDGAPETTRRAARENAGQLVTDSAMRNRALNNQASKRLVGKFEAEVEEILVRAGMNPRGQVACDRYNIDLLIGQIAVEVHTARHFPRQGSHFPGFGRRIETLLNAGVINFYVWCPDGVNDRDGEKLVAELDRFRRKPPFGGEYGVFRCEGYPPPAGRPKSPDFTVVPAPGS
jgi:hypothetical protein